MAKERWPRPPVIFTTIGFVSIILFYFACRRFSNSVDKWRQSETSQRFFARTRPEEVTKAPVIPFESGIKFAANFAKDYMIPDLASLPRAFAKFSGIMFICMAVARLRRIAVQFVKSLFTKTEPNYIDTPQTDEWIDDSYIPLLCGPKDGQIAVHRRTPSFANVFPEYKATAEDEDQVIYSSRIGSSGDDDFDASDEETQNQNVEIPDILTIMKHMPKTLEAADVYLDAFERLAVKLGKTEMVGLIRDAQIYLDKRRKNLTGDQAVDSPCKYSYVMKRVDGE